MNGLIVTLPNSLLCRHWSRTQTPPRNGYSLFSNGANGRAASQTKSQGNGLLMPSLAATNW